ncbi:16S rRNA (cytosine(1402)-N(4))-methyltransferase RsmH [Geobacter sp. DSM 9736]|uniref:16S rRNA (cytosine(1402)-N(4))-methyltransferase RsmH n=1 Tax=Geobacter sp. DSM 9736 TaxID=1277350 RepID=UPI000B608466|nr:16S rRNA (cytosine(1402)-N(4))-methyltransferase RsmH [Geobacter sp. DSM 9736]SNB47809.1 16S rRNA (cytosine1402-N4)-methyltransferase [Geobacter sp. DSM 9736]
MEFRHASVMLEESLRFLAPRSGGIYVDGTLGGGGHAERILADTAPDGRLIAFDKDPDALSAAGQRLSPFGSRVRLVHGDFAVLSSALAEMGIDGIDGIMLDLGVSSHQLDSGERGFSFQQDAPLDMRMDTTKGVTAADIVNNESREELIRIIREYGEERWASRIASAIVRARETLPVTSTLQLAELVKGAIPRPAWEDRIHPATRTFQGLRIAVNDELGSIRRGLPAAMQLLNRGGRAVVISFHSLEDRIVKDTFRSFTGRCTCPRDLPVCVCGQSAAVRILTAKPVRAGEDEIAANPRARSARLRAAEKL